AHGARRNLGGVARSAPVQITKSVQRCAREAWINGVCLRLGRVRSITTVPCCRVGRVFEAHHASGGPRRLGPPYELASLAFRGGVESAERRIRRITGRLHSSALGPGVAGR